MKLKIGDKVRSNEKYFFGEIPVHNPASIECATVIGLTSNLLDLQIVLLDVDLSKHESNKFPSIWLQKIDDDSTEKYITEYLVNLKNRITEEAI